MNGSDSDFTLEAGDAEKIWVLGSASPGDFSDYAGSSTVPDNGGIHGNKGDTIFGRF